MPKESWSTPIEHSSDATFRAWGSDLSARFAAAGLVQTADTGQINWVTVTRPTTLTFAGYEIWRFDDALQATSPVFIKVEYGTANSTAVPAIRVTVSSATNGAGTSTGLFTSARLAYTGSSTISSTITNYQSYATHTAGFFGLAFKIGAMVADSLTMFAFTVQRSNDNTGAPTADAVVLTTCGTSNQATAAGQVSVINYTLSSVNNAPTGVDLGFMPMGMTTSIVDTSPQIFLHWVNLPQMSPLVGTNAYILSEVALSSERAMTLVGTTPRNYIAIGNSLRKTCYNSSSTVLGAQMLWEV